MVNDMQLYVSTDEVFEQLSDEEILEEVKIRGLNMKDDFDVKVMIKSVENHSIGKHGSEGELVKLCYDMVGRIFVERNYV